MAKSRTTLITEYLLELVQTTPVIQNCWLSSADGLKIGAALPWLDGEIIDYWGAAILSNAQRLLEECHLGKVKTIQVFQGDFQITVVPVGEEAVFVMTHRVPTAPEIMATAIEIAVSNLEKLI